MSRCRQEFDSGINNLVIRLGGTCYPPQILYKIFTKGMNVHYFSGDKIIEPGSKAAEDSFNLMGRRTYLQKIFCDDMKHDLFKVGRSYEVTDRMEYVQVFRG